MNAIHEPLSQVGDACHVERKIDLVIDTPSPHRTGAGQPIKRSVPYITSRRSRRRVVHHVRSGLLFIHPSWGRNNTSHVAWRTWCNQSFTSTAVLLDAPRDGETICDECQLRRHRTTAAA